jgi:uncharacterized protein YjeT (DUF2065 family)
MKLFITILGLVMVIEGIPYFTFPEKMKELLVRLEELPPETLRLIGFISMAFGLLLCYLAQRTSLFS